MTNIDLEILKQRLKDDVDKFKSHEGGMSEVIDIVMTLVLIVIVGAIGIFIADQVVTTTGTPSNTNLSAMRTDILSAGDTGSGFIVILIIAFVGAVAIGYMFMLQKRGRR